MSTVGACGLDVCILGLAVVVLSLCSIGFGLGSSVHIFPCLEHATHTVSLAPSIMAWMGLPLILRPQTSHRNWLHTFAVCIYSGCVYSCRISV